MPPLCSKWRHRLPKRLFIVFRGFGANIAAKSGGEATLALPLQRRVLAGAGDKFTFFLDLFSSRSMVGHSGRGVFQISILGAETIHHSAQLAGVDNKDFWHWVTIS